MFWETPLSTLWAIRKEEARENGKQRRLKSLDFVKIRISEDTQNQVHDLHLNCGDLSSWEGKGIRRKTL